MFCPKCGSNQGERRFCTSCGTNLAAVSQSLQGTLPANSAQPVSQHTGPLPHHQPFLPPPLTPYEMERQREYANGMKMLLVGGAFLAYNILKFILSFGHSGLGFFGFVGLVLFAIGLSKVLSWRQLVSTASHAAYHANHAAYTVPVLQTESAPMPAPNTAQLNLAPKPVFSAAPPGTRTDELEPMRRTNNVAVPISNFAPSITEDDTRHLPNQKAEQKANWKME